MGANQTQGTIDSLDVGAEETLISNTLIGFGRAHVYVSATPQKGFMDLRHQYMKMYMFYHNVLPGGSV